MMPADLVTPKQIDLLHKDMITHTTSTIKVPKIERARKSRAQDAFNQLFDAGPAAFAAKRTLPYEEHTTSFFDALKSKRTSLAATMTTKKKLGALSPVRRRAEQILEDGAREHYGRS